MNETRLKNYEQQLLELEKRLSGDISELTKQIGAAGVIVGSHTSHTREPMETEILLEKNEEAMQQNVRAALKRITGGSFGKCIDCDGRILKPRLDALPYTPICIQCERKREA